jgi:hypothetical protein
MIERRLGSWAGSGRMAAAYTAASASSSDTNAVRLSSRGGLEHRTAASVCQAGPVRTGAPRRQSARAARGPGPAAAERYTPADGALPVLSDPFGNFERRCNWLDSRANLCSNK